MSKLIHWLLPLTMLFMPLAAQEPGDTVIYIQPPVTVKASAPETGSARSATFTYAIADSQIRSMEGMSLDRMLRRSGLVYIRDRGGRSSVVTVSLRGSAATQTSVTLNGFSLVNEQNGLVDLGMYPPDIIGSVALVRGAQSVFTGSGGVGGVIRLRTPEAESRRWEIRTGIGSFGYRSAAARIPFGGIGMPLVVRTGVIVDDGAFSYDVRSGGSRRTEVRNGNQSRMVYGLAESQVSAGEATMLSAFVYGVDLDRGSPGPLSSPQGTDAILRDRMVRGGARVVSSHGDIVWEGQVGAQYHLQRYQDRSPLLPVEDEYANSGVSVSARAQTGLGHPLRMTAGVDFSRSVIEATTISFPDGSSRAAIYALLTWSSPGGATAVYPSVRYDTFSDLPPIPSWKLSIHQALAADGVLTLRLGVGTGFRIPSFNERFWRPGGNPKLRHETSLMAEGGLSSTFAGWGQHDLQVLGSYATVKDKIVGWPPENAERTRQFGVEASWAWQPVQAITVTFGGAYADVQSIVPVLPGKQFPYIPRLTVSGGALISLGGFRVSGAAEYASRRYTTTDNLSIFSSDPYMVISGTASFPVTLFGPPLRLTCIVDNILDSSYEIVKGYPMPGRSFTFTASLEFDP